MLRTILACVVLGAAPAALAQDKPVAITGARIMPASGAPIDNGALVVQGGKIVAVGAGVAVPADAQKVDATGKTIIPGLVDTHSHIGGIGGADASASIQPEVRIYDSLNPLDSGFKRAVAGGITTMNVMPGSGHLLSGQTVYLKPRGGRTVEELFILDKDGAPMGGLKMANGTNSLRAPPFSGTRGKSAAMVRERYLKAQEYSEKAAKAGDDAEKKPSRSLGDEALLQVMNGARVVHHHTHRADDIMTVLRLAKEFKWRVVLHHVSEAWKVADEIAKAGVPCSVIVVDSPGGKLEAAEMRWESGAILEKAGAKVAFHTDDWITDSRLFMRSAALAVRAGMSREGALKALTIHGAEMLDLGARVGSLEVGKDADFVILSGDPLSVYTHVQQTWIEGRKVFDRDDPKDHLYATGGYGAGHDQSPYFCCFDEEHAYGGGGH